jgi:cardiolipin synthase
MSNFKKISFLIFCGIIYFAGLSFAAQNAPVHTLLVEPDDRQYMLLDMLEAAKTSIDLVIYEMDDPDFMGELKKAAARGVKVRVLYNYHSFPEKKRASVSRLMASLEAAGVMTKPATSEFSVTHQKTFVLDGDRAVIMTFNLQRNYFSGTRDFGVITVDTAEVAEISAVFDADWDYSRYSPSAESLVWSPDNSRAKISGLIDGSRASLDIYNEEVEDKEILGLIGDKAKKGAVVRLISARLISGGRDLNYRGRLALDRAGAEANYLTELYSHAKMVLSDYMNEGAAAYVGSENFSGASLDRNRELGIIVREKEILERLENTFETDWAQSRKDF